VVISFSIFHQPEVLGQPKGTYVWWGYGLHPNARATLSRNRWINAPEPKILEECCGICGSMTSFDVIMKSSICIPCNCLMLNKILAPAQPRRPACRGSEGSTISGSSVNIGG